MHVAGLTQPAARSLVCRGTQRGCHAGRVAAVPQLIYAASPALDHDWPGHPESAARVPAILDELVKRGLTPAELGPSLQLLPDAAAASEAALRLVHTPSYLAGMRVLSERRAPCLYDADTYVTQSSWQSARLGVGTALALVDAVCSASKQRLAPSGFALCRPPGHHALPQSAMGFCLLSTAALAARHAQQAHGLARVAIYDFDTHHGNGTEAAFANDPSVLYLSTHQAGSFPHTGALTDVGTGPGEGSTVNVPLPGGSGDAAARAALEQVVGPCIDRFKPDIIIASAGYDAHWRDPLAGLTWRDGTYHAVCTTLRQLAEKHCAGRLVLLLEGGYDLRGLSQGAADSFGALLGMPPAAADADEQALLPEPADAVAKAIAEARAIHSL